MKIQLKPSCCGTDSDCCNSDNLIDIEFLFLDLYVCERCQGSDKNLDISIQLLQPVLNELGYFLNVNKLNINTEELAIK